MDLFDLFVKLSLDDGDFQKGVESAKSKAKSFADSYTSAMENAAGKVANFGASVVQTAAKIGAAVTGAVGMLGTIGMNYNMQMESYTTNFGVMLGSTEAAAQKVEELKTLAAKTPFDMSSLADATQTLLAFQVPADESTGILSQLGDIALGDKEKLSGLATVFGQVSSAGKLQGQDLMQMINQGFNPLNFIAERTGESMEELRERMSKGKITADEVTQAIADATSEGGQFYKGMESASQTTEGLLSTLKDDAWAKLGEIFSGVSEKVKEALPKVIEFVNSIDAQKVADAIGGVIDKVISFAASVADTVIPAVENFFGSLDKEELLNTLSTTITSIKDAFIVWSPVIAGVAAGLGALYAVFQTMAIIDTVKNAFVGLNAVMAANPIGLIVTAIAALVAAFITLYNTNEDFRNGCNAAWDEIKEAFTALYNSLKPVIDSIKEAFSEAWEFIQAAWDKLEPYFSELWEDIQEVFSDVTEFFGGMFSSSWEAVKIVWDVAIDFFENIWDTIATIFGVAKDVLSGDFSGAWEKIKECLDGWGQFFQDTWDSIKLIFEKAGDWFKDVGKNIVDGIKQGIKDKWDDFKKWAKNIFKGLTKTAEEVYDEHSPSRVFQKIGENLMLGMQIGMKYQCRSMDETIQAIGGEMLERSLAMVEEIEESIKELRKEKVSKRNKEVHEAELAALEQQKTMLESSVEAYEKAYESIIKAQDNLENKLKSFGDLMDRYTEENVEFIKLGDIREDINALTKYGDALEQLKARGVSQEFLDEIISMNLDDAMDYTDLLLGETDQAFGEYISLWELKQDTARRIAEEFYADQVETLTSGFSDELFAALGALPDESEEIGENVALGIAAGMEAATEKVTEQAGKLVEAALNASKAAAKIKSPSALFRDEVGKMMAAGVGLGFDIGMDGVMEDVGASISGGLKAVSAPAARTYDDGEVIRLLKQLIAKDSSVVISPSAALGRVVNRSAKMYGTVTG